MQGKMVGCVACMRVPSVHFLFIFIRIVTQ